MLTTDQIKRQSECALAQWKDQWTDHAKIHSTYEMKSLDDFKHSGFGKAMVLVGNGGSLEDQMPILQKNKDNVDILACDKALGHLIKNGIKPKFVILCDANVDYEKYMKPFENELKDTILISNVCANPKWTQKDKWKDIYFFLNIDSIQSEKIFQAICPCPNLIPAATNVSGAMVVLMTQCLDQLRQNFFGYDKYLLVGFDYCFIKDKPYYAYNHDGDGKRFYMNHSQVLTQKGQYCMSSSNLIFSAKWLQQYINIYQLPVIQCSEYTIMTGWKTGNLEKQIQYRHKPEHAPIVQMLDRKIKQLKQELKKMDYCLQNIGKEHYSKMLATV